MKFQMPEKLEGLDLEAISKLLTEATAEAHEINAIADDAITAEQSADLVKLIGHMDELAGREDELKAEAGPSAEDVAAARARLAAPEAEVEVEDPDEDDEPEAGADVKVEEKEAVLASAGKVTPKRSFAAKVASKSDEPTGPEVDPKLELNSKALSITASANIKGFESGQKINSFGELAVAYAERSKAFAGGASMGRGSRKKVRAGKYGALQLSKDAQRFSVATLAKPENPFSIGEKDGAQQAYDVLMAAASEYRLEGGSLLAAGGWCSPSEQVYGFLELESADGLLSIAEINARRGGIQFTKGPTLGELLLEANLGFVQTEAEAEAGEVKPVFDIECPDWEEVRMDAVGYAIRAGLLTNATYPELLRRYLSLGLVVHARRMNALTISRISTLIGATVTFSPVGAQPSAVADLLSAIELRALQLREQYSMPINSTVEGVFPLWVQAVVRSDLSRRLGVDMISVTDQMITAWFTQRKVKAQFVRDYQSINSGAVTTPGGTGGWTAWPDKVEFLLYPAGSFVKLTTDVIDLDTVYDTDDLTQNRFMAAFFEEGFGIANTGGSGLKTTVGLPNLYGSVGYPSIGALANVAPI
jgi:hypothetical protein